MQPLGVSLPSSPALKVSLHLGKMVFQQKIFVADAGQAAGHTAAFCCINIPAFKNEVLSQETNVRPATNC